MTDPMTPMMPPTRAPDHPSPDGHPLRQAALDLEAAFLAEMLKHARFGAARGAFGGGAGENHFASLMRVEHARAMAANGGVGLAETLFEALLARDGAHHTDRPGAP